MRGLISQYSHLKYLNNAPDKTATVTNLRNQ